MRYGKIQIEDGCLVFTRHMMLNNLPCQDIVWAYVRRDGEECGDARQLISCYLVVVTKRKKKYQFDMSHSEAQDCVRLLKVLNPDMAVGFPKGGRIQLQSLPNTRDLGALPAADGRHIIPRKLLRSGDLYHVSMADKAVLMNDYRLKTVIDMRSDEERSQKPDTIMAGVEYYHVPILDEQTVGFSRDKESLQSIVDFQGNMEQFMEKQYQNLILDVYSVKQYACFIDVILHHKDGAVLWHCSAGKDRAGIGTAILLSVLGVSEDVIREDYMRTNRYLEKELAYMECYVENRYGLSEEAIQKLRIMYGVKEEYLDIVFRTIKEEYGTMEKFFRRALYLTPKSIEDLKDKYLL